MKQTNRAGFNELCARPERVCWVVAEYEGQRSICPLGWKMNTSGSPPMMAISVAPQRFTHDLIAGSGEFVLSWPGEDLAQATLFCGTKSGRDVDKFEAMKLTVIKGKHVASPLIAQCVANLECKLVGQMTSGDHTIFVGEVLAWWINEDPKRQLCTINKSGGYDFLLEKGGYRFGVVKY